MKPLAALAATALLLGPTAVAAQPVGPGPAPFGTEATELTLPPGDGGPHFCRVGYVVSARAMSEVDNANVRVVFLVAVGGSSMSLMGVGGGGGTMEAKAGGPPLPNATGFRLAKPAQSPTVVELICGH